MAAAGLLQPSSKILISGTVTASGASPSFIMPFADAYRLILVTSAATGTTPTLDLVLQDSPDNGVTWINLPLRFAQQTAVGSGYINFKPIGLADTASAGTVAPTGGALAVNTPFNAKNVRASFTVSGTTPSFTYVLYANMNRARSGSSVMSSPQVVDSAKMAANLDRFLAESAKEKHSKAFTAAMLQNDAVTSGMDGSFKTTDSLAQLGRPLTRKQVIDRLTKLNANLIFEQSRNYPDMGAVYVRDGVSNLEDIDVSCRGRRHIVGMEWTGISPEFTTRRIVYDQWKKPKMKGQIRGWRTILQRLIKERLITVDGAEKAFAIARGRESQRWYEEIH